MERWKAEALERMAQYITEGDKPNGCTGWTGGKDKDGYPMFWFNGKTVRASRALCEILYGLIPAGYFVMHKCDDSECLQADHFKLGLPKDNTQDALSKGRMTGPRKVSQELELTINEMREAGYKIAEISAELEISIRSVYNYLRRDLIKEGEYASGDQRPNLQP